MGILCFYLPGLVLIAMTTVPGLLGDTFNKTALSVGLLGLWPLGTGIVKAVVNVFGAKQFHPLIQSALIESYYVELSHAYQYRSIGRGIIVPIMCQHNVTVAYFYSCRHAQYRCVALYRWDTPLRHLQASW
jgi:POT family proton-dependent oligopeptide transporter